MRLFKKETTRITKADELACAERIAKRILSVQRKTAGYLNRRSANLSFRSWLVILIVFSLMFGAYCMYLIIQAFN